MGYSGLDSWIESDNAAAFVDNFINDKCLKKLNLHIKKKANEFNTTGIVDVGLFLEIFNLKADLPYGFPEFIQNIFIPQMKIYIKQCKKEKYDIEHLTAFNRILKHTENFKDVK